MWIFLLPEASKISEWLTAKWPLWDDLIQSPAGFLHLLWSLEAAFYFIIYALRNRKGHSPNKETSRKQQVEKTLHKIVLTVVLTTCLQSSGHHILVTFFSLSDPRFHLYPESHTATGQQIGRAVVTWCLSARLDSRRAASWHALCSTFMGTWSWLNKRGDLCETRKEAGINKPAQKEKRHQNASQKVWHSHAEQ